MIDKKLAQEIKSKIEKSGFRKNYLAKRIGIHPSMLSHYMYASRAIPKGIIHSLRIIGINIEESY